VSEALGEETATHASRWRQGIAANIQHCFNKEKKRIYVHVHIMEISLVNCHINISIMANARIHKYLMAFSFCAKCSHTSVTSMHVVSHHWYSE
jgi:hypothetical protein